MMGRAGLLALLFILAALIGGVTAEIFGCHPATTLSGSSHAMITPWPRCHPIDYIVLFDRYSPC
jgi:hypothetical protein